MTIYCQMFYDPGCFQIQSFCLMYFYIQTQTCAVYSVGDNRIHVPLLQFRILIMSNCIVTFLILVEHI